MIIDKKDELGDLMDAVRETHKPIEEVTHGSDSLKREADRLVREHGLDNGKKERQDRVSRPKAIMRRVGAGAAIIGASAGLYALGNQLKNTEYNFGAEANFSDETNTWVAGEGDGFFDAAKTVEGSDQVDLRIIEEKIKELNPEATTDGIKIGEQLIVPVSVTPEK